MVPVPLQMTGGAANVVYGVCDSQTWQAFPAPFLNTAAHHTLTVQCSAACTLHWVHFPLCRHPDLDWLERELAGPSPPSMVVLVNPCNPTGAPC
jgi:hypothetical protein